MQLWQLALLGTISLILNCIGYLIYIRHILKGKVKPHAYTWAIWSILTIILAVNQFQNHGGYSKLFFVSTAVLVFITFLLSIKHGMGGANIIDEICLLLAAGAFIYWLTQDNYRTTTLVAVLIDAVGAVPTIIKTYNHPESETYAQWGFAGLAGLFAMMAVPRLDWVLLVYPAYIFLLNMTIVTIKYARTAELKALETVVVADDTVEGFRLVK